MSASPVVKLSVSLVMEPVAEDRVDPAAHLLVDGAGQRAGEGQRAGGDDGHRLVVAVAVRHRERNRG